MAVQDRKTSEQNHERFIKGIVQSREVWALQYPEGGFAVCASNEFEDTEVYVFWSDKAYAERCCEEDWGSLTPVAIALESFLEEWLPGMHEDNVMVGPNWDSDLCGLEVEPEDMAEAIEKHMSEKLSEPET